MIIMPLNVKSTLWWFNVIYHAKCYIFESILQSSCQILSSLWITCFGQYVTAQKILTFTMRHTPLTHTHTHTHTQTHMHAHTHIRAITHPLPTPNTSSFKPQNFRFPESVGMPKLLTTCFFFKLLHPLWMLKWKTYTCANLKKNTSLQYRIIIVYITK